MSETKVIVKEKDKLKEALMFTGLTGIAIMAPLFGIQSITGPIVNAVLFITTAVLGVKYGIFAGLLPSVISLFTGLLPLVLWPMIPFIIIGNAILVLLFHSLRQKNYWLGVSVSSAMKFLFLLGASRTVIQFFIKQPIASKISAMMSLPQFFTALAGGVIAYLFLKLFKYV